MKNRIICSALGGLGALGLGLAPGHADETVFSPGLLFAADTRGPDGLRQALGLEMTLNRFDGLSGVGALFQLEFDFDGGVRVVIGAQGSAAVAGVEAGLGLSLPGDGSLALDLQLAPFLSIGYISAAGRLLVSGSGLDLGIAATVKLPLTADGPYDWPFVEGGCADYEPPPGQEGTVCGRPARDAAGRAWRAPVIIGGPPPPSAMAAAAAALAPADRTRLAAAWLDDARDEHAAIAAFARLARDLALHGAPRALVRAARRAVADEIRHARAAFDIASALAGRRLAPLPVPPPSRPLPDRATLAAESWLDGAMNEGRAAAEAAVGFEGATVPAVRRLLRAVGREEAGHGLLGAAVAEWAAGQGSEARRALVEARDRRAAIERSRPARRAVDRAWGRVA